MAVTLNAKGTSVSTFMVGKDGPTLNQNSSITVPTATDFTFNLDTDQSVIIDAGTSGPALITATDDQDLHINPAVGGGQYLVLNDVRWPAADGTNGQILSTNGAGILSWSSAGAGSVTDTSVTTANGFSGSVATSTTTPAITISTTVTGVLKGNGTAISAATPGTDYLTVLTGDVTTSGNAATLATVNSNVGQYAVTTVNAKGLVTAATDLLVTGDVTGMSSGASIALTLATANSSPQTDTFRRITVNSKGLVTATSAVASGDITTALGYTPLNKAGDTMTGNLILNADPTAALGAVTKQYVDTVAAGLNVHQSCVTATTATLATSSSGTITYDNGTAGVGATLTTTGSFSSIGGYTTANGNRILVKNEATQANNGIYVRTSATVLTRAADFDNSPNGEVDAGDFTFISNGTLAGTNWAQITEAPITIGTTAIVFSQLSGPGVYVAGTGIDITSNSISNTGVLSVAGTSNQIAVSGSTGNVTFSLPSTISGLSSVSSTAFTGALTGAASANVLKAGDTMTGALIIAGDGQLLRPQATTTAGIPGLRIENSSGARTLEVLNLGSTASPAYGADAGESVINTNTGPLKLSTADTLRMTIGSVGNVTIAAPTGAFPALTLAPNGNTSAINVNNTASNGKTSFGGSNMNISYGNWIQSDSTELVGFGQMLLGTVGANPLYLATNSAIRATIDSAGNMGIGAAATNKLDVIGNSASPIVIGIRNDNAGTGAGTKLQVGNYAGTETAYISDQTDGSYFNMKVWKKTSGYMAFGTNDTERMRIDSTGNIGIGRTPAAGYRLDILGANNSTGIGGNTDLRVSSNNETVSTVYGWNQLASTGTYYFAIGGTSRMAITSGGIIEDGAGNELGWKNIPPSTDTWVRGGANVITTGATVGTANAGDTYSVYNNSGSSVTLTASGVTMYLGGTNTSGNRTLLPRGFATIWFRTSTECVINGNIT